MTSSQVRQVAYFALAALGLLGTAYFNAQWFGNDAFDHTVKGFVEPAFGNSAASSVGVDLSVVCLAAWVLIVTEARKLGMQRSWLYVVGSMVTAIAFAFPLFLGLRERRLSQSPTA